MAKSNRGKRLFLREISLALVKWNRLDETKPFAFRSGRLYAEVGLYDYIPRGLSTKLIDPEAITILREELPAIARRSKMKSIKGGKAEPAPSLKSKFTL
jgi:hypothetical protein